MPAPSATCELYIDGVRVPDTADQYEAGLVTAMDGLSLTWGRDGQNEQPGPASLSIDFLDPAGNNDILDVLHVGSDVAVWAEGQVPQDSDDNDYVQTFDDGTFDTWPLGTVPDRWTSWTSSQGFDATVAAETGHGRVLQLGWKSLQGAWTIRIPPRPFSPTGTLPDAWDDIPRYSYSDGTKWGIQFLARIPAGWDMTWGIVRYTGPYVDSSATSGVATITGTGDWQQVAISWSNVLQQNQVWLGLYVSVRPVDTYTWQAQTGTWVEHPETWADHAIPAVQIDNILIGPPAGSGTTRRVLVFSGQASDVLVAPAGDGLTTAIVSTAMDLGAELGNTVIGDNPWPVQTAQVRGNRIAQLAGITANPRIRIDDSIETLQLSYRDVDAQPAFALLQDLAQSIGGVLWVATHAVTGPFLWVEDPATRAAVQQLVESGGIITITGARAGVSIISACDLLEDPVSWRQDTADVITVVAVTWLEQGVDDDGQPATTERTVTITDPSAVAQYGTRRLSIATELIAEADATAMANRILAQARAVAWRLDGLVMDTAVLAQAAEEVDPDDDPLSVDDATREVALLDLLDGTIRMGAAVTLVDMPAYAPRGAISSVYVEGGKYTFTGGYWVLQLTTTPSAGQGQSVTWGQMKTTHPTWRWNQLDPGIAWLDLFGVTV